MENRLQETDPLELLKIKLKNYIKLKCYDEDHEYFNKLIDEMDYGQEYDTKLLTFLDDLKIDYNQNGNFEYMVFEGGLYIEKGENLDITIADSDADYLEEWNWQDNAKTFLDWLLQWGVYHPDHPIDGNSFDVDYEHGYNIHIEYFFEDGAEDAEDNDYLRPPDSLYLYNDFMFFETLEDAEEKIEELEGQNHKLRNGETKPPKYRIVNA